MSVTGKEDEDNEEKKYEMWMIKENVVQKNERNEKDRKFDEDPKIEFSIVR